MKNEGIIMALEDAIYSICGKDCKGKHSDESREVLNHLISLKKVFENAHN